MGLSIGNVKTNLDNFVSNMQTNNVDVRLGLVTYGDTEPSQGSQPIIKTGFTTDLNAFKASIAAISVGGGGDTNESGLEAIKDPGNGALTFSFAPGATKQFILVTDAEVHDNNDGDGGDGESAYDIDGVANDLIGAGVKLSVIGPVGDAQLKRLSDPTQGSYLNINGNFTSELDNLATTIIDDSGATAGDMPKLNIQVGANAGDVLKMDLFDSRSGKLGIAGITVDPHDKAIEALGKIDGAIDKVSQARSYFGAYQNRLTHIASNVTNYGLNITESQSRIADVDMAKETLEMVKNNILTQASQTMLAQANQVPQSVLQLLR